MRQRRTLNDRGAHGGHLARRFFQTARIDEAIREVGVAHRDEARHADTAALVERRAQAAFRAFPIARMQQRGADVERQ